MMQIIYRGISNELSLFHGQSKVLCGAQLHNTIQKRIKKKSKKKKAEYLNTASANFEDLHVCKLSFHFVQDCYKGLHEKKKWLPTFFLSSWFVSSISARRCWFRRTRSLVTSCWARSARWRPTSLSSWRLRSFGEHRYNIQRRDSIHNI